MTEIKETQSYTVEGKTFTNREDAEKYCNVLGELVETDAYIQALIKVGHTERSIARVKRVLKEYIEFKHQGIVQAIKKKEVSDK